MFGGRLAPPVPTASADFCRPIPAPCAQVARRAVARRLRQSGRSPRVRRAAFVPYTRCIHGRIFRVIPGFGLFGSLARMRTPHAMSVRQAGALLTASFRFPLAVRLDRPAFNRTRLKAEKSIGSRVLEQPESKWTQVALAVPITRGRRGLSPPSHRPDTIPAKRCSRTARHAWRTKQKRPPNWRPQYSRI